MSSHRKVLVVDDEPAFRRSLEVTLSSAGFSVVSAADGGSALETAVRESPDMVVLDLGLPGLDGRQVIRALRGWTQIPILVLSARHDEQEKVLALDGGADDYVTKPFSMDELLARVRAHLRRSTVDSAVVGGGTVETDDLRIDLGRAEVSRRRADEWELVHLTPKEWGLVDVLVRASGRLVTQRELLKQVWGPEYGRESNYLRVFMGQVRAKLEPAPSTPRYFHTEPGLGYRFEDRPRPAPSVDGGGAR